jgi:hypothetical protein
MRLKWLRALSLPAAGLALLVALTAQGPLRGIAAQAGAAAKPPEQDTPKKETE